MRSSPASLALRAVASLALVSLCSCGSSDPDGDRLPFRPNVQTDSGLFDSGVNPRDAALPFDVGVVADGSVSMDGSVTDSGLAGSDGGFPGGDAGGLEEDGSVPNPPDASIPLPPLDGGPLPMPLDGGGPPPPPPPLDGGFSDGGVGCSVLGVWQASSPVGTTWIRMDANGDYFVDVSQQAVQNATVPVGTYTVVGTQVTLNDNPPSVCIGQPGTYAVAFGANCLSFTMTVVTDVCGARASVLNGATFTP